MRIYIYILIVLGTFRIVEIAAFNSRVNKYGAVKFRGFTKKLVLQFELFGQEFIADLEHNRNVYHKNLNISEHDIGGSEFKGRVREPYYGEARLSQLDVDTFLGALYFYNDTLHLEPAYFHNLETEKVKTIGYYSSDTNITLNLSSISSRDQVTMRKPNPFEKFRRKKRETNQQGIQGVKKNRCALKLVADYSFFSIFGKHNTGIVTRFLVNMITRVNEIYGRVNWDEGKEHLISGRGKFVNLGFSIKEIKVLDRPSIDQAHYNIYNGSWKSEELLKRFAIYEGSNDFCLVHLVTARTFKDFSTLGLAYIAHKSYDSLAGGLCSRPDSINGRKTTMNVLLSTVFGNGGSSTYPLLTKEFDVVVAHEYGHAWGSIHDPTLASNDTDVEQCYKGSVEGGSFIMSPFAQRGYDPNNVFFSPCSKRMIREVLNSKWRDCFEEEKTSDCGNGVVEENEECDNGVETNNAHCCDKSCKLVVNAKCSPLNHICCTETCQFHNSSHVCLPGDGLLCKADAVCNGISGDCPPAPPVENGKSCIEDGECLNGACLPFCEKRSIGKKSCVCMNPDISCHRCCRAENGTCQPEPNGGILRDGTPCSIGICKNKKCVNVAVDQVRSYFLAPFQNPENFMKVIKSNLVVVVVIIVSISYFSVYLCICCRESKLKEAQQQRRQSFKQVRVQNYD